MDHLFDKPDVCEYRLSTPCKKSARITELRKIGDTKNQYVTNVYYLDTLSFSYDNCKIYSSYTEDDDDEDFSPVYSSFHSDCDYCLEHKQRVKENLIVGYKIYPKNVIPKMTYKQRKELWRQFL
jgi:hypothetical protein